MEHYYLLAGLLILSALIRLRIQNLQPDTDASRPDESLFPKDKIANDKLVLVEGVSENDLSKILQMFCNSYNRKAFQALPRLIQLSDNQFAVTFPYDINFEIYCYFINYVNYPPGFDRHFKTVGWATTTPSDSWITEKSVNKNVMLYISDFDEEYDNVFLTTSDNVGYKLGFAIEEEMQLLDSPEKSYVRQPVNINELDEKPYTDFK